MELDKIGISTAAFFPGHLTEDALDAAAELGFRVMEVFLQAEEEYTARFATVLERRRRSLGLEIHSLHLYATSFDLWSTYPRRAREIRERFERTLEVAQRVGAGALTWHGLRYGLENPRLVEAFFESTRWAGEKADAAGVTLCIENVSWCYLRAPEHVRAICAAGLPVGFTFDGFQALESGVEPTALVRAMGQRLVTVHLSDYREDGARHLPPGEGEMDWMGLMRELQEVAYDGPLILETARVGDVETLVRGRDLVRRAWEDAANTSTTASSGSGG